MNIAELFYAKTQARQARFFSPSKRRPKIHPHPRHRRFSLEPLEPRLLLSAELKPYAAAALAGGFNKLDNRLDDFLSSETLLDERVPMLLTVTKDSSGNVVNEAPTINDLSTVPVDANGDGQIDGILSGAEDETVLQGLDANHDGKVGVNEFLKGWFFDPVANYLNSVGSGATTTDFADFLKNGGILDPIDRSLNHLGGALIIDFDTVDAKIVDTTENPDAEVTFSVGFELSITRNGVPLDLGLEADALKLLAFTGTADNPELPKIDTVTSKLDFGFDFGVFTGGQEPANIDQNDFFIRKADPMVLDVTAKDTNMGFNLNVGFLGAQVINGSLDLQADIDTALLDPNTPAVLGFAQSQYGAEETSGLVTATNAVPNANLAHDAGFFLRVGNVGITTPVTVADNNRSSLTDLRSDIETALADAGLNEAINVSLVGDKVQFSLVSTSDTPLGFANESLGLTGTIAATPAGDVNQFEYSSVQTFLLSVGGAVPKLVDVTFPDPAKSDIGFGNTQQAALVDDLVAPNAPTLFDITGDANFTVTTTRSDGTQDSQTFTLTATDTDGNANAADLAADIDAKLNPTLTSLVEAGVTGDGKIRFYAIDPAVTAVRSEASGTATSEIGFASAALVTLKLTAADPAVANLADDARFKITVKLDTGGGTSTSTYSVTVPDNNRANLSDLAGDINEAIDTALGADKIDVTVVGGKIVLVANDASVLGFSVITINQNINDLVEDVNRALDKAGLGAAVTAGTDGTVLTLTSSGAFAGKSLEISKTLTFDAGVTYAELNTTPMADLFDAQKGDASHVQLNLPVQVLPGIEDAATLANWNPPDVVMVGNFSPFDADSTVATYDTVEKRFNINFTFDPATTVPEQDTPVAHADVPLPSSLTDEVRLVNFAELLNFNLVGAEGMVGLVMSLGTALQQIADSGLFANYGIPFSSSSLSKLLNFADSNKARLSGLIDMLVFDTGGDGIDGSAPDTDRLLKKISANGTSYLIPAFSTAQTLATTLNSILGAPLNGPGGINATYDTVTNELTYQVDLLAGDRTTVAVDVPFEYDVALSPFAKLTFDAAAAPTDKDVHLTGRTGLGMTFGINLSPPGAVIYPDTKLSELNGGSGVDIKTERAITGIASIPQVTPATPTPAPIYQLSGDAIFSLVINGGSPVEVTVARSETLNRSIGDLVADVNNALAQAHIEDQILAAFDGSRLVLTARNNATTFLIGAANTVAYTELGLLVGTEADQADFVVFDRAGGKHAITLDSLSPASTVQDVIDLINSVTGAAVTAGLNATHTGLRLVDKTGGTGVFRVETINGSGALLQLGFFRTDNTGSPYEVSHGDPNLIEGGAIGLTHLDSRFFVRDAQMRLEGLTLQTPDVSLENPNGGVPGTALFGIVGVNTNIAGTMYADVTADLKDPDTGTIGGQVTLKELFDGAKQGRLSADATFSVDLGAGPVSVTVHKADTIGDHVNNSITDLAADVNGALQAAALDTQIYAKADGTRLVFTAKNGSVPSFTITASGTAITELGLSAAQTSEEVGNIQTLSARAASRFAVADPVVAEMSTLDYDAVGILDHFTAGKILTGAVSGATAVILAVEAHGNAGTLTLCHVRGAFQDDEDITDGYFGAAVADGVVTPKANFGDFNLHVIVQPGFDDNGFGDGFLLIKDKVYDVPFSLTNFGNPFDPQPPVATMDLSGIGDLAAFEHLNYSNLDSALQGLLTVLQDVNSNFTLLNTKLPAINKSVSDLLSLVDGFARSVDNANAAFDAATLALDPKATDLPALTLQNIPKALRGAFGMPVGIDPNASGAVDWVKLDFDTATNMLLVGLSLDETVSTKLGLDIAVGSGLPNLTSGGVLQVTGSLDVRLNFGIDLDTPENAYLFDSSSIAASLKVVGEGQEYAGGEDGMGLVFRAALGPLAVFIQDGDALIDVAFSLPGLNLGVSGSKLISVVAFEDFKAPDISKNTVDIVLPMFYGGEGPNDYIGDFSANGTIGGLTVNAPDFSGIAGDITSGVVAFDPFDNILLAVDTVNFYLEGLSDMLAGDVLGINLPFVGDQMADVLFIEEFRNTLVRTLKSGIENAINPNPDTIVTSLLTAALGGYLDGGIVYSKDVTSTNIADWYRQWNFTLHHTDTIVLDDFDIGIPGLGFDVNMPVNVAFTWEMDLGFGVNFAEGAYIDVSEFKELDLDLAITLPAGTFTGTLGFLQLKVTDPDNPTGAKLNFDVDVKKGNTTEAHLGFSDLGSINPVASLTGTDLNGGNQPVSLYLKGEIAGVAVLPRVSTSLIVDWSLPETALSAFTYPGNAVLEGLQTIAYQGMTIDGGSIVTDFIKPILDKIHTIIEPFMPVVDTLTYPIPILSDIAGEPFTLLDLAAIFGDVNPDFIEAVADILTLIDKISDPGVLPDALPIGDLTLYDVNPSVAQAGFDPTNPASRLSDVSLTTSTPGLTLNPQFDALVTASPLLKGLRDQEFAKGLSTPILTDPLQGVKLLLDQNATLIDYVIPPLGVEFSYLQVFPIFGPLSLSIEIGFGFTVDLHSVGFDTYGLERFAKGGFRNPGVVFDGFYLNDLNAEGVDAPEVTFEFGLVGAAELNLGIARAGVGGGIDATINFDWHDSIPDGHVHVSEIAGNILSNGGNPLAAFDVSGALTFQMFAFLEISIIGFKQEFPITPETTLFSFDIPFERPPVLATDIGGGVLQLNMGPNAKDRLNGDTSDDNEEIFAKYDGGDVLVWSPRLGVDESDAQSFSGVSQIVGLGGEGNDTINLNLTGSGITYTLEGGNGDDTIIVTGGTGGGVIRGGVGNDTLTGDDGDDIIYGEEGNDVINGGGGQDIIFGDHGRVVKASSYVATPYITSRARLGDGADEIHGGDGDDIIFGGGGNDKLFGDGGNDIIIGDGGRFEFSLTADGHVDVAALRPLAYTPPGIADYVDPDQISRDIDALYDFVVDRFHATDLGLGGNDEIHGGAGDDIMLGGSGDDTMMGDNGADVILGGKGFDEIHGGAGDDMIFGGDQADTIYGDDGNDVISGGAGNDFIHGNAGNDVIKGDSGADIIFGDDGDDLIFGQTEPDILFGGAGNDLVVGGSSNDIMFGDEGVVAKLNPADGTGYKVIYNDLAIPQATMEGLLAGVLSSEGNFYDDDIRSLDLILTYVRPDDGNDFMSGDAGDDFMFGGGGNDTMGGDVDPRLPSAGTDTAISEDVMIGDGGMITFDHRRFRSISTVIADTSSWPPGAYTFDDIIYGDNGNDYIFGGQGGDFLFGGHGKVVTGGVVGASRGPTDAAASDNDIIVGDNGRMTFADATFGDGSQFGDLKKIQTTDISNATGGNDYAEGQLGNDVIFGGVNNGGQDVLFGNVGDDVILGDNGELDFAYNGDTNLTTLDLIRSYRDGLGGTDEISGDQGNDVLIGGTGGDIMYGDNAEASSGAADGGDIMLGDNGDILLIGTDGRLKVQVAAMTEGTAVDLITTTDIVETTGGADTMSGNAGDDIILGGVNNGGQDTLYGDRAVPTDTTITNDGDDILLGDNGLLDFSFDTDTDRNTLDLIRSFEDALGGPDTISGNKGQDVVIGGTGGDTIFGDDATASAAAADLGDLLLGDNADIFLVKEVLIPGASGSDLKLVLGSAVKTIRTTDTLDPTNTGGSDTISGNAGGDIIAGGVYGDTLYGDRETPTTTTTENDGDDIILGDNGAFEWLSTGRLNEITGIDIAANNPALWAKYGTGAPDTDLTTLDLVTTEQPNSGGRDLIYGDNGRDLIFGGTDADVIYGDDGDETGSAGNSDVMFGDHGRLYPQFSTLRAGGQDWRLAFNSRNFFAIDIGRDDGGEGDLMWGEEGDDTMLGQQGDDRMWGGSGNDDMTGGHNVAGGWDELDSSGAIAAALASPIDFPSISSINDLMDGGTGDDSMAGDNAIIWRRGDTYSPRFRVLEAGLSSMYTTTPDTIATNVDGAWQPDPYGVVGRDIELLDHSFDVQNNPLGRFGNDVMAGGPGNDTMFGELGNDLMQGDGFIQNGGVTDGAVTTRRMNVSDIGAPSTAATLFFKVPEAATDGDDYMEGNGGDDLMYGGLGQDDMIGGSSELFGLTSWLTRPDGSDIIYGGAGTPARLARNDFVGSTDTAIGTADGVGAVPTNDDPMIAVKDRHSRDADFIMGDDADIFRLVGTMDYTNDGKNNPVYGFLQFNYDQTSTYENRGLTRIIPRAMVQLDYTLGGADYKNTDPAITTPWNYVNGAAGRADGSYRDNGAADLIYGESGDDIIFGMTDSDIIFGNSDDDDVVGGYGNDWISGGTGQDGVLGDDGLVYTSRNSTIGEPLYGIAGLLAKDADPKYSNGNALDETIATPGQIQYAIINQSGQLKKAMDLVPFSYDHNWIAQDDEFPDNADNTPYADDIIFGGLGSDWLHGGSGDDAISGAEALDHAFVPINYSVDTDGVLRPHGVLDLGYLAVGLPTTTNPGDVLAFNPDDLDGRHLNNRYRAGEFYLYDEYSPLHKILLNSDGTLWDPATQLTPPPYEFLLNFNKAEGVYRAAGTVDKATGQQTDSYPAVNDDGRDAVFGDNGNDWLVGGTGADDMYGGWGNDLMNADDDQTTNGGLNDMPDTHPFYQDRAYGGAGRDVLIGNTGGDRLIDWVGEYNSYLVPYAPFGEASVSRTMQPFLPEFLYALSAGDGADPTRYADNNGGAPAPAGSGNNPNPGRNGEPSGELGLVLQKDFAWQDQTGAPSDPQAGNIPGGARDVLRTAGFNDGMAQGFFVASGTWSVTSGRYNVAPATKGADALSVFYVDQYIPNYFEMLATIKAVKPTSGYNANAYLIFDYQTDTDLKFAGINVSTNKLEIGYRDASGWHVTVQKPYTTQLKSDTDYNVFLALNGSNVILTVNNQVTLAYTFAARVDAYGISHGLKDGMVGLGANNGKAAIDNVTVQRVAPVTTVSATVDFASGTKGLFEAPMSGNWTLAAGRYVGTAGAAPAIDLTSVNVTSSSLIEFSATFKTTGEGGFVYDEYAADDFKFVTISAGKITLGHRTSKGWFTDAVYTNASLTTYVDYTLGLTLKGTTVSVTLNGQTVVSRVYNALVTDGNFGLLSRSGVTSFDTVTFKSDDPAFQAPAAGATLIAAQPVAQPTPVAEPALASAELDPIVDAAISRWAASDLLDPAQLDSLADLTFVITDLGGTTLALTEGNTILIDTDAAGHGWFVDATPDSDSEFKALGHDGQLTATRMSPAAGDMDLLTVVMHEIGHVLGYGDLDPTTAPSDLMSATLGESVRRLPREMEASLEPLAWDPVSGSLKALDSEQPLAGVTGFALTTEPAGGNGSTSTPNPADKAGSSSIDWTRQYVAAPAPAAPLPGSGKGRK